MEVIIETPESDVGFESIGAAIGYIADQLLTEATSEKKNIEINMRIFINKDD